MEDYDMKKILIATLLLASAPSAAYATQTPGVVRVWGLCGTDFPGLGWAGHIFLLPCRILETPSNA
jgi:hypothetical protein